MNLRQKIGIILIAFSVLLYFAGYFLLVEHAPNPFTNPITSAPQFFNNMLLAFFLLLIGVIIMFVGAELLVGGND